MDSPVTDIQPPRLEPDEVLRMIRAAEFRNFTPEDWGAFADCSTQNPQLGVHHDGTHEYVLILDGSDILVLRDDDRFGGHLYQLVSR